MPTTGLTNIQQELLKIYSKNISDEELKEVKIILARYFAQKASSKASDLLKKQGITNDDLKKWLDEE
jgi:stage III sporulation protein SpoIIIAA